MNNNIKIIIKRNELNTIPHISKNIFLVYAVINFSFFLSSYF